MSASPSNSATLKPNNRPLIVSVLFTLATGLTAPIFGYLAWQTQAWQLWAVMGINLALSLTGLVSLILTRRNQPIRALWLLLGALVGGALLTVSLLKDTGILGAILVVALGIAIASQGLPRAELNRTLIGIVIAAFAVIGISLLTQPIQYIGVVLGDFLPVAAFIIIIVFGFYILRQFPTYPLPTKLLVALLGVVALGIGIQAFVVNLVFRNQLTTTVGERLQALSESKAQEVIGVLEGEVAGLRVITLNKFVQDETEKISESYDGDLNRIQQIDQQWRAAADEDPLIQGIVNNELAGELREFQRVFPYHIEVFITDKFGANIASTNRTSDYYQADEDWWQGAVSNGLYIGQPEFDDSANQVSVIVALPLPAHDRDDIVGVLRTTLNLQAFGASLAGGRLGDTGQNELFLPNGSRLEVFEGAEVEFEEADEEVIHAADLEQLFNGTQPYVVIERNGVNSFNSQTALADVTDVSPQLAKVLHDLNWRLVVTQAESEALSILETNNNTTLFVVLAALLAAGILATLLTQFLTQPITRLTETATKIAGGDLTAQAPVETDDEVGALATAFNVMTVQLKENLSSLENRVAERTRALAASADVSRRLSTLLDRQKLVSEVVEQVKAAFGYYHVHIYFWDEARAHLEMAGGTGEAGRIMLENGHKIPKGRGLVGRAAETNAPVLVLNTLENPNWLPNALLPNTRSELAVPIALGDRVLGVLDVQQDTVNGLSNEDMEVLQSLANQVALATQNARTFAQTQRQADVEALVNTIGQKIQAATTVETALQVAAREVGRALGGTKAVVRLNPQTLSETTQN